VNSLQNDQVPRESKTNHRGSHKPIIPTQPLHNDRPRKKSHANKDERQRRPKKGIHYQRVIAWYNGYIPHIPHFVASLSPLNNVVSSSNKASLGNTPRDERKGGEDVLEKESLASAHALQPLQTKA